ncbi:hypothetical protein QE94_004479 [Salmonella enterica subsp. enterica]|nr:hypothetical protein [Salmonella enterica subsp. enterica]
MDHLVIQPLVRQHAANAAFYWHQKEESRFSPLVKGYGQVFNVLIML